MKAIATVSLLATAAQATYVYADEICVTNKTGYPIKWMFQDMGGELEYSDMVDQPDQESTICNSVSSLLPKALESEMIIIYFSGEDGTFYVTDERSV